MQHDKFPLVPVTNKTEDLEEGKMTMIFTDL
jgi:hypothetical protein